MNTFLIKSLLTGLFLLGCLSLSLAQPVVSNIRTDYTADRMKITYDVQKLTEQDSVYLQIASRTKGLLKIRTVTGDVGRNLSSGTNKVIYWDFALDGFTMGDEAIQPIVGVKEAPRQQTIGRGPLSALASIAVPGLGNMLVHRKVGYRPLITVAYGGLLVYGFLERQKANDQYDRYMSEPYERDAIPYYDAANQHRKRYMNAFRGAGLILAADVIYSVIKGIQNDRLRRTPSQRITVQYFGNTPTLAYHLTF